MALVVSDLVSEVQFIIGDVSDQFRTGSSTQSNITLRAEVEIANTVRWLTTNNVYYWNVRHTTGVTHSNGVISLNTVNNSIATVISLTDSGGNSNYTNIPYEEFYQRTDVTSSSVMYSQTARIGFIMSVNPSTGADQLLLDSALSTPSGTTFNLVYSEFTESVPTTSSTATLVPWIPNRLRPFIVSFTAAQMLAKMDSPDKNLIQLHTGIAGQTLKSEEEFGKNRGLTRFQHNGIISQNLTHNVRSNYQI